MLLSNEKKKELNNEGVKRISKNNHQIFNSQNTPYGNDEWNVKKLQVFLLPIYDVGK